MKISKGDKVIFEDRFGKDKKQKSGVVVGGIMGKYKILSKDGEYEKTEQDIISVGKNVLDE